jgi:hypothetical protein
MFPPRFADVTLFEKPYETNTLARPLLGHDAPVFVGAVKWLKFTGW